MGINSNNKEAFNELLFENRNKSYGAYLIRKNYDRRMVLSMFMTLSLFVAAMIVPNFFGNVKAVAENLTPKTDPNIVTVVEVKSDKPNTDPKPITVVKKGLVGGTPRPVDSNAIVKIDTVTTDPNKMGDPKGTDTTKHSLAMNLPTGGGGGTLPPKHKDTVDIPDVNPEYPGGITAFYEFLKKNIKYPKVALENEMKGTVYISFIVDENGKVSNIKNLNKLGGGLELEAIRVAGLMPDWKPGILNGEKVPVKYNVPVKFALR